MTKRSLRRIRFVIPLVAVGLALAGCGSSSSSSGSSTSAAEAKSAATGDIPDNQQFLRYKNSAARYSILYPQGWARKGSGNDVTFSDKDNSVEVQIANGGTPTVSSVSAELKKEASADPTLKPGSPQAVKVGGSPAIHVVYHVQGPPDPVTGQKPTLMVDRYVLANKGRVATVNESTPVGVDNVDAYLKIIQSFRWG
jgi:PsbP